MATLNSHGMEPQEEAIMDLWDAGLSREEIAARVGLSQARVRSVTGNFAEDQPSNLWRFKVPAATARLGEAVAKALAA